LADSLMTGARARPGCDANAERWTGRREYPGDKMPNGARRDGMEVFEPHASTDANTEQR
jgi:hypothetical protein